MSRYGGARKHGHAARGDRQASPTYRSWSHMVARCQTPADAMFPDYGGRGIRVADEWVGRGGFARFLEHIGERPSLLHSVDRVDSRGHYEPGNVRWATDGEQARNRCSTIRVTIGGVTKCAKDWCAESGVKPDTAYARIKKGWAPADAVTCQARKRPEHNARSEEGENQNASALDR